MGVDHFNSHLCYYSGFCGAGEFFTPTYLPSPPGDNVNFSHHLNSIFTQLCLDGLCSWCSFFFTLSLNDHKTTLSVLTQES